MKKKDIVNFSPWAGAFEEQVISIYNARPFSPCLYSSALLFLLSRLKDSYLNPGCQSGLHCLQQTMWPVVLIAFNLTTEIMLFLSGPLAPVHLCSEDKTLHNSYISIGIYLLTWDAGGPVIPGQMFGANWCMPQVDQPVWDREKALFYRMRV